MIPIFKPKINKEEVLSELGKIFDAGFIGMGPKVKEFEEKFAEYIGTQYAVGLNSATAALHLACVVLGIKKGDEVILPAMTFVSTGLAPLYCGATPVFADIEEDTLCLDPEDIERKITKKTKAIIVVHYGGHAAKMDEIMAIAEEHDLFVIEDCAHATGGKYKEKMLGSIGHMGCFSFHAVKNLTTGDGGMITVNGSEMYKELKKLSWCGIDKSTFDRDKEKYTWRYSVDNIGYKYHMNDIAAVIGISQLKSLDADNQVRRWYTKKYNQALKGLVKTPIEKSSYTYSANHNYVIQTELRDELNSHLASKGISTGVHYNPINYHQVFGRRRINHNDNNLPVTVRVAKNILTLPLYPDMMEVDFKRIVMEIENFFKNVLGYKTYRE